MKIHSRPRRGFTLIELLVVIAIIAQLAAILFPVFAKARENARRASCQSNLRQIGMAFMQYEQDYDEGLPFKGPGGCTQSYCWLHSTQAYTKSYQVFKCPSDTQIAADPGVGRQDTSYSINAIGSEAIYKPTSNVAKWPYFPAASEHQRTSGGPAIVTLPSIESPTTTVQLLEGNTFEFYSQYADFGSSGIMPIANTVQRSMRDSVWGGAAIERHLGKINVLWCDGHVKPVSLDLLATKGEAISGTSDFAATYFTTKADPM